MKKVVVLFLIIGSVFISPVNAQQGKVDEMVKDYTLGVGLRGGKTSGVTGKFFSGKKTAFEVIVGLEKEYFNNITLLYERHTTFFDTKRINWYYGAGGHIITFREDSRRGRDRDFDLGLDVILGVEYKIPALPLAVCIDLKPYVETGIDGKVNTALDPGIGIKLAFF